ncbi:RING finger protein 4 [Scomber scombrus]|uniref:RING finger protein 4 n=1 Tax=Scomber scombrus TaxID=13677 RepID=A0AAV1QCU5_SCOSC
MNASQRKRRTTGSPPGSRSKSRAASRNANASRESDVDQNQNQDQNQEQEQTETISVLDQSVEDVVDLTCEEAAVVDLTHSDSVLLVTAPPPPHTCLQSGPQNRRTATGESYVVSSDEDEATPPTLNATTLSSIQANSATRLTSGVISCPICMDSYSEIVESGRLVVSSKCGHVFCSQCLRDALKSSHTCPTCRKKLTSRQYHPLYI